MDKKIKKNDVILIADDDDNDVFLTKKAFQKSDIPIIFKRVTNGEELMNYLVRKGEYEKLESSPRPSIILLDLNMPKMDGKEVLVEIKQHPDFKKIPVIVLSTSKAEEDINRTYFLGANSYIVKPTDFKKLVNIVQSLSEYWLKTIELPI